MSKKSMTSGNISTFHLFLVEVKVERTHAQANYCECAPQKGAYQPRNAKIHNLRSMAFSAGKKVSRYSALCRESIYPFFASICEGDPDLCYPGKKNVHHNFYM